MYLGQWSMAKSPGKCRRFGFEGVSQDCQPNPGHLTMIWNCVILHHTLIFHGCKIRQNDDCSLYLGTRHQIVLPSL